MKTKRPPSAIRLLAAMSFAGMVCAMPAAAAKSHGACAGAVAATATLHWSESAQVVSPSRAWAIEVDARAGLRSDDNETPVTLVRCADGARRPLFVLDRAAKAHWGPRGDALLVANAPGAGHGALAVFDAVGLFADETAVGADRLDRIVRDAVRRRLGPTWTIAFYTPSLLSWRDERLTLRVALQAVRGANGPLRPFCYDVRLDLATLRVREVAPHAESGTHDSPAQCGPP